MSEIYNYKGYQIKISQDSDSESPRSWDNLGTIVCKHKRYSLGDEAENKKIPWNDFNSWADTENYIYKNFDVAIILPIFMYDHSGIQLNTTGFSCGWDSGQVGFIFIEKSKVKLEYSVKRISKQLKTKIAGYLRQEVKTYSQFLEGDVYGYKITDTNGDEVDSCWGFYGSDAKEEAMMIVDGLTEENAVKFIMNGYKKLTTEVFDDYGI